MLTPTQKREYAASNGYYPGRSKSAPAEVRYDPTAMRLMGSHSFDYSGQQGKLKTKHFQRELFPEKQKQNKEVKALAAPSLSRQQTRRSEPQPSRKRKYSDVIKTPERPPRRRRSENVFETQWDDYIANTEDMPCHIFRTGVQYFKKKRLKELDEILDSDDEYIRQRKKKIQHIFSYLISFTKSSGVTTKTPVGLNQKHAYMKGPVVAKLDNLIKTPLDEIRYIWVDRNPMEKAYGEPTSRKKIYLFSAAKQTPWKNFEKMVSDEITREVFVEPVEFRLTDMPCGPPSGRADFLESKNSFDIIDDGETFYVSWVKENKEFVPFSRGIQITKDGDFVDTPEFHKRVCQGLIRN